MIKQVPESGKREIVPGAKKIGLTCHVENCSKEYIYIKRYGGLTQVIPPSKNATDGNKNIRIYGKFLTYIGEFIFPDIDQATSALDAYIMFAIEDEINRIKNTHRNIPGNEIEVEFEFVLSPANWKEVTNETGRVASHILGFAITLTRQYDERQVRSRAPGTVEYAFHESVTEHDKSFNKGLIAHHVRVVDHDNNYSTLFVNVAGKIKDITPVKDLTVPPGIYITCKGEGDVYREDRLNGSLEDPNFIKTLKANGIYLTMGEAITTVGGKLLQESESKREILEERLTEQLNAMEDLKQTIKEKNAELVHLKRVHELNLKAIKAKAPSPKNDVFKTILGTVASPVLMVVGRWLANLVMPKLAMLL